MTSTGLADVRKPCRNKQKNDRIASLPPDIWHTRPNQTKAMCGNKRARTPGAVISSPPKHPQGMLRPHDTDASYQTFPAGFAWRQFLIGRQYISGGVRSTTVKRLLRYIGKQARVMSVYWYKLDVDTAVLHAGGPQKTLTPLGKHAPGKAEKGKKIE